MIKLYLLLMSVLCYTYASAQNPSEVERSWPMPDVPGLLFYIQRDPDVNTVVYTLNTDKTGHVNQQDSIKIFWIKYTEGGKHKPLNILQKDLPYGVSTESTGPDKYNLKAVAYPKMEMQLQKEKDNNYRVRLTLDNRKCTLKRIFIRIIGGSHLHPDVAYLEFHGTELLTGKEIIERVSPN